MITQSSEVFTKADLRNMLLSKAYSCRAAPTRHTPHDAARRQGYMDALIEIAIELGIIQPDAKKLPDNLL